MRTATPATFLAALLVLPAGARQPQPAPAAAPAAPSPTPAAGQAPAPAQAPPRPRKTAARKASALLQAAQDAAPATQPTQPGQPPRLTLSVREADLQDILRAATDGTDINLSFEQGLDTRVRGLELKAVTFEELLETILPSLGLTATRQGRSVHISRGEGGLRFYQVDQLALSRTGTKSFQVNASGQVIQGTGGQGGGGQSGGQGGGTSGGQGGQGGQGGSSEGGNSSSYLSTLSAGNAYDPWRELELGLSTLVFSQAPEARESASVGGSPEAPKGRSYAKDGRTLILQPEAGMVVVGADPATHKRVEAYLREMRRRSGRQVLLEARIVEVTLGNDSQIGVDWKSVLSAGAANGSTGTSITGNFATGVTNASAVDKVEGLASLVVQNARVLATLSALAREGRLQVLSAPRISTLNNQKAILRVVREEAFFLQSSQMTPYGTGGIPIATVQITPVVVPVGIVLDIQPQVGEDGTITLAVNPSVSEIVTTRTFNVADTSSSTGSSSGSLASATLPVVDRRDLDTVVKVRSGETLVLAGIIRAKDGSDDRGVPWLRRIPLLGNLFSKKEKTKVHTELAIFITPTLVEDGAQVQGVKSATEKRLQDAGVVLRPEDRPSPPATRP